MWVTSASEEKVNVELIRARPTALVDRVFQAAGVTIDGAPSEPTLEQLTLYTDGTYLLGTTVGRYHRSEEGITLDGAPAQWGRGAYAVNGQGLVFNYYRGLLVFQVRYEEQVKGSSSEAK